MATTQVPEKIDEIPFVGKSDDCDTVISIRQLSYWYGTVIGLNNISIDIGSGIIGLLGPNGAGKSTFLKLLTGQLPPRSGSVKVLGNEIRETSRSYENIGFVPEQDAFYEEMTALQFVRYFTQLQGYTKSTANDLAEKALDEVDLLSKKDIPISKYSKGMRQRVKIAQAIAHNPQILFLDEPLTGTDPVGRHAIIELIRHLGDSGKTIIVSSHILHEIEEMTHAIIMINRGRIIAEGDIYKIRNLIEKHPLTISVMIDNPRAFASHFTKFDDVISLQFGDNSLKIRTKDPYACFARIPKIALANSFDLRSFSAIDNNLQAIFDYLVDE